jgi:BirA family biotin operon repressor/biotin-[acetyl-CoA-carboxylase] ligase
MKIIYFPHECIDSTNTWAKQNCHLFPKEALCVVWAKEQTHGRGRHGRSWISPHNENCYASFVFATKKQPFFLFSQCMAVVLQELLIQYHVKPLIKWPNDILIEDKKIAGILVETAQSPFLVVGVGLNINMSQENLLKIPQKATSLFVETGKRHDPFCLIERIAASFSEKMQKLEKTAAVWQAQVQWMVGQKRQVITPQQLQEGIIERIELDGTLHLRTDSATTIPISSGEIFVC